MLRQPVLVTTWGAGFCLFGAAWLHQPRLAPLAWTWPGHQLHTPTEEDGVALGLGRVCID